MPALSCLSRNTRSGSQRSRSSRQNTKIVTMSMDNTDKTVKESRVFAYRKDGRRFTAGHCIETEIHAMAGSYPCPAGSRRVPAMVHSESEVFNKRIEHDPLPGLPQGYQSVQSTVQRAWYRGDLNTWEARWDYTHDIAYRLPQVWDKCFDGYCAFKEDLKHHKDEIMHLKEDWKYARETMKQRVRSSSKDYGRAFRRMAA